MSTTSAATTASSSDAGDLERPLGYGRKSGNNMNNNNNSKANSKDLESMRNSVADMTQRLKVQRQMAGRPLELENMTQEQLMQEKYDIQHALLDYEHMFGHPSRYGH